MATEFKCRSHLVIKQTVLDYACVIKVILYLVYVIWTMRNTWKAGSGGVDSNFIPLKDIWYAMVQGFLISLHEINKCKILKRLCSIYGLVGTKMDVSFLSLSINMSSVLAGLLYGCSVKFKNGNKGSKWYVRELIVMGVWYCDIGIIKWLGIFKPQFSGSKEQYKIFYI